MPSLAASSINASVLVRWLRATWLGWIALALLLLLMSLVVKPRVELFLDYWYSLPADSAYFQSAENLRALRQEQIIHRAWIIGATPVALLFFMQTLLVFFDRYKNEKSKSLDVSDQTIMRDAEKTQMRHVGEALAGGTVLSSLDGDGALYIGPGGRYRVDRLLASGGMGSVHEGYDKTLQRKVAIKELDINLSQDEEQQYRFRQEALALADLAHPYIVPVYDLLEENNHFWIVMELLSGGDLEARIEKNRLTSQESVAIIRAVAEGLAFAHNKGVIHRDIKPMNILFNADGVPKLVDFGIAKLVQSQQSVVLTREGLSLGSPTYMSPEQAAGSKHIDKRADIYALGITFYKMLVGEAPFTGEIAEVMAQHITQVPCEPKAINASVSDDINAIVLKMLEKSPDNRYQSLEAFIVALDQITNKAGAIQ